jgi:hypothetical protein
MIFIDDKKKHFYIYYMLSKINILNNLKDIYILLYSSQIVLRFEMKNK